MKYKKKYLGWNYKLPERQNRVGFVSSFAIGLCAGIGKIANVLTNALAKGFLLLTICVGLLELLFYLCIAS